MAILVFDETLILTFNHLESIEVHYMEKIPGMFSSKSNFLFLFYMKDRL